MLQIKHRLWHIKRKGYALVTHSIQGICVSSSSLSSSSTWISRGNKMDPPHSERSAFRTRISGKRDSRASQYWQTHCHLFGTLTAFLRSWRSSHQPSDQRKSLPCAPLLFWPSMVETQPLQQSCRSTLLTVGSSC